jgi:hypothetical protein
MDDQNIHGKGISDSLMRELIENSVVRLAICEGMRKIFTPFAAANLPVLFAGPKVNPGANFVRKHALGETCDWTQDEFSAALGKMLRRERLTQIRARAAALSGHFSASPVAERLWRRLKETDSRASGQ